MFFQAFASSQGKGLDRLDLLERQQVYDYMFQCHQENSSGQKISLIAQNKMPVQTPLLVQIKTFVANSREQIIF